MERRAVWHTNGTALETQPKRHNTPTTEETPKGGFKSVPDANERNNANGTIAHQYTPIYWYTRSYGHKK
jgi:hypothetical protein